MRQLKFIDVKPVGPYRKIKEPTTINRNGILNKVNFFSFNLEFYYEGVLIHREKTISCMIGVEV